MSPAAAATAVKGDRGRPRLPRGPHALSAEEVARNQRERIFAALAEVIAERGYQRTSVARISAAAGVSTRSFYRQFADKTECVLAFHERSQERLLSTLREPCEEGGELADLVRRSLDAGLRMLATEPALAQLLTLEAPAAGGRIARRHFDWLGAYAALLTEAGAALPPERRPSRATELTLVGGIASRIAELVMAERVSGLSQLGPELSEVILSFYGPSAEAA